MTEPAAREQLWKYQRGARHADAEQDEVDALASGAVHATTANTIRPPLQLIKTAPVAPAVSSVFLCYCCGTGFTFTATAHQPRTRPQSSAGRNRDSVCGFRHCLRHRTACGNALLLHRHLARAVVEKVREATRLAQERKNVLT